MEIKDRIKALLDYLDINQKQFAELTGISENTISNAINGKNTPGLAFFNAIQKAVPDVNPNWLYMGDGNMLDKSDEKDGKGILRTLYHGVEGFISKITGNKIHSMEDCEGELDIANRHIEHLKSEVEDKKEIIQLLKKTGTR